jgi:hypothetical protein
MSREIDIGYRIDGERTSIEVRAPYFLLGTQQMSEQFWSSARLRNVGIERLTQLGMTDPICFEGWEDIADLGREIKLLGENLGPVEFSPEIKAQWLSHLVYCYHLLVLTAPKDAVPVLSIG